MSGGNDRRPNPNKSIHVSRALHVKVVESIYDLIGIENEQRSSNKMIGETIGIHDSTVGRASLFLKKAKFLTVRQGLPPDGSAGKAHFWTLHGTKEDAIAALRESWTSTPYRLARKAKKEAPPVIPNPVAPPAITATEPKVAIAPEKSNEEVRAIAGPEPENPFAILRSLRKDESGALVEAARQYMNRTKLVDQKIAELEAAGIHVERSAIKMDRDERFETIGLVISHVDRLESAVHSLSEQNNTLRKRMADYDRIKHDYETLQRRFRKDVAAKVALDARYPD